MEDLNAENNPKHNSLRVDDLDVYSRIVAYDEKCTKHANKFINRAKWSPMSHRFDVFSQSQEYFQDCRQESLSKQKAYGDRVEVKANELIEHRKLGERGLKELATLMNALPHVKKEKKIGQLIKD